MSRRLLENTFASQKFESILVTHVPNQTLRQVLIITLKLKEITHFPQIAFFENLFPLPLQGVNYEAEKLPSLQPSYFWCALQCHNLDSSMLKCEGSLTNKIFTEAEQLHER